ncbi:hypothetical protein PLICRDRAFT_111436 [Plicaturopsis crispa FD-325 SS-3]|nr:hypothetical protein PLICRDRAFT_111436 [Plicaturopsis crispa FD-325 SS-3]
MVSHSNLDHFPPSSISSTLLLATLPSFSTPHFLAPIIQAAASATRNKLTIILFSRLFNRTLRQHEGQGRTRSDSSSSLIPTRTESFDVVQRLLTFTYVQATRIAQDQGKVLMQVDVLLKGFNEAVPPTIAEGVELVFRVKGDSMAVSLPQEITALRAAWLIPGNLASTPPTPGEIPSSSEKDVPSSYPVVALGGTFDHLHAGHKILLSMGAWIAHEKLIVGVTDTSLLGNKSHAELLQPLQTRMDHVRAFLTLFSGPSSPSALTYDITPIADVYGPTGHDPYVHALVVSRETLPGASSIDKERLRKGMESLKVFVIDVISATEESVGGGAEAEVEEMKKAKMSSTWIREWIARTLPGDTGTVPS